MHKRTKFLNHAQFRRLFGPKYRDSSILVKIHFFGETAVKNQGQKFFLSWRNVGRFLVFSAGEFVTFSVDFPGSKITARMWTSAGFRGWLWNFFRRKLEQEKKFQKFREKSKITHYVYCFWSFKFRYFAKPKLAKKLKVPPQRPSKEQRRIFKNCYKRDNFPKSTQKSYLWANFDAKNTVFNKETRLTP